MKTISVRSDVFGALASTLCVIHCVATPFIFIAHTCSASCCESSPGWWQNFDYVFLVLSFWAVARSAKTTSKPIMKPILWFSWFALFLLVSNGKMEVVVLPQALTHATALALAVLHLYNLKYCNCKDENCCVHSTT